MTQTADLRNRSPLLTEPRSQQASGRPLRRTTARHRSPGCNHQRGRV